MGNFTEEAILDVRQTWYAMCSETDYMLGEVMDVARRTGHQNNTVIIFTSGAVPLCAAPAPFAWRTDARCSFPPPLLLSVKITAR
eukprot:SAG11_NODE_2946_length_2820_cov_2.023153_2_plen_85_part_00